MRSSILPGAFLIGVLVLTACGQKEVSYKGEIQPILQQYCLECHGDNGEGYQKSGLLMTSHENLMKGTIFSTIFQPDDSRTSAKDN